MFILKSKAFFIASLECYLLLLKIIRCNILFLHSMPVFLSHSNLKRVDFIFVPEFPSQYDFYIMLSNAEMERILCVWPHILTSCRWASAIDYSQPYWHLVGDNKNSNQLNFVVLLNTDQSHFWNGQLHKLDGQTDLEIARLDLKSLIDWLFWEIIILALCTIAAFYIVNIVWLLQKAADFQVYCIEKAGLNIMSNQTGMCYHFALGALCLVAVQMCIILHLVLSNNNIVWTKVNGVLHCL